ncbi:MAG: hypothetical protein QOI51_1614 [Nocardioidaceae bacterium]|nr:hypothetical protein [Nocardioidaceae bacterium]MDX6309095.1 hypothetical protein [Nocardioidaceae bacterium]
MNRKLIYSGLAAGVLAVGGLAAGLPGASAMPAHTNVGVHAVHVCAAHPKPGHASCMAMVLTNGAGKVINPMSASGRRAIPTIGINSAKLRKAYHLTGLTSGGRTVAIVDAFGYSGLESDLATFRSHNGLPACTTASGCLTIENQTGGSVLPPNDAGWDVEQALDVDAVSSACPDCKILMVQGNSSSFADLETAENTAAAHAGVVAISNSYGSNGGSIPNQAAYNHPGIAITASTGDSGFSPGNYPASDTHVVAVGGTSLFKDTSSRGYHETAWSGAGSGCGANPKPKWQGAAHTTCTTKASADVSAAADPNNGGLIIYCGTVSGCGGFEQVGGTSESSPIIAAVYALSGNTAGYPAKIPYANTSHLFDVTSGSNGTCGVPLCTARVGWDGPTGLGTPNGVAGF